MPRRPNSEAANATVRLPSIGLRDVLELPAVIERMVRAAAGEPAGLEGRSARFGDALPAGVPEADARERDPELAEDLDRDQEAREDAEDRQEFRHGEWGGDPEAVQRVAQGRERRPDRDEDRREDAAV